MEKRICRVEADGLSTEGAVYGTMRFQGQYRLLCGARGPEWWDGVVVIAEDAESNSWECRGGLY